MKRHLPPHRRGHRNRAAFWPLGFHRTRVLAVQCGYCRQWVKPRYIRWPTAICRSCEHAGHKQTWQSTRRPTTASDSDYRGADLIDHPSPASPEGGTPP
jgi:hypothetical protein